MMATALIYATLVRTFFGGRYGHNIVQEWIVLLTPSVEQAGATLQCF